MHGQLSKNVYFAGILASAFPMRVCAHSKLKTGGTGSIFILADLKI